MLTFNCVNSRQPNTSMQFISKLRFVFEHNSLLMNYWFWVDVQYSFIVLWCYGNLWKIICPLKPWWICAISTNVLGILDSILHMFAFKTEIKYMSVKPFLYKWIPIQWLNCQSFTFFLPLMCHNAFTSTGLNYTICRIIEKKWQKSTPMYKNCKKLCKQQS